MRPTHSYLPALDQGEVRETTLDRVLIDQARLTPAAQALARVTEDGSLASAWSYGRLRADSVGLALALLSRFAPGERIAIRAGASPERARLVYAAAFAGLTVVAIPPGSPAAATSRILDHSGAAGLFIDGAQEAVAALRAELGAPAGVREVSGLGDEAAQFAKRHAAQRDEPRDAALHDRARD